MPQPTANNMVALLQQQQKGASSTRAESEMSDLKSLLAQRKKQMDTDP